MEETNQLVIHGIYKHYKGDYLCARPKDMFLSEVDHAKHPDVQQKWRFELQDIKSHVERKS